MRKPKTAADEEDSHDRRGGHGAYRASLASLGGDGRRPLGRDADSVKDYSALNGDGGEFVARRYERDFLLSLRHLPACRQPLPELEGPSCEAILARYTTAQSSHSSMNGEGGNREGGGGYQQRHIERRVDPVEKEGGANSSGWREAAANNAASASSAPASGGLAPATSLRPLGLRPVSSLRPGLSTPAATTSSVGRLKTGKQTSFNTQSQGGQSQQGGGGQQQGKSQQNNNANGGYRKKGPDTPMDIEVAPLAQTEKRYTVVKDIPPDEKLLRELKSILNKLTPEKFDVLLEQVLGLRITNAGLLRDCVTAVFEKALAEPHFSPLYAQFCVRLSESLPSFPSEDPALPGDVSFRKLILNQAQAEFENSEFRLSSTQLATMSEAEKEQHAMMVKRRTIGTIRFIGELYIRKLIASRIMTHCITLLFGDIDKPVEEDIEALCRLLETTGKTLETSKGKDAQLNQGHSHSHLTPTALSHTLHCDRSAHRILMFCALDRVSESHAASVGWSEGSEEFAGFAVSFYDRRRARRAEEWLGQPPRC